MEDKLTEAGLELVQLAWKLEALGRHTDAIMLQGMADDIAREIRSRERRKSQTETETEIDAASAR